MSTLISIDYDFFVRHGMYDAVEMSDGRTMPGMLVYDWQMNEQRAPEFENMLWRTRAANFSRWGLDIRALTQSDLSVADFATEISIRIGGEPLPAWHGDSHGWAGIVARDYDKAGVNVLNFDAHHDLGYYKDPLAAFKKSGRIMCDDWALIGLNEGWIKNYTVVYPDWLMLKEWPGFRSKWLREVKDRVTVTTWSKWLNDCDEIDDAQTGYFCRSSSWTPPWMDKGFQDLCEEFGYCECIDCALGQAGSPHDTCELREWDWAEVEEEIRIVQEAFERLTLLNKKPLEIEA